MKQIFNWLREEVEASAVRCGGARLLDMHTVRTLINKAEMMVEKDFGGGMNGGAEEMSILRK